ncbi:MAG: hypothetical protein ABR549_11540 [Mycobacteriales bacterium]
MSERQLIRLDETLWHQAPFPFRFAGTSDPRFYDRFWFGGVDPGGTGGFLSGLAFYKNVGVCDGYAVVQRDDTQRNARFSRRLAGDLERTGVGDLDVEVDEPFRHLRVRWSGERTPLCGELAFTADFEPWCEAHYLDVSTGTVSQEITRYNQIGHWDGWFDDGSGRVDVERWWAVRDHSWGVRPGVAGIGRSVADPATGAAAMLHAVLYCATEDLALCVSVREDDQGRRTYLDGEAITVDGQHDTVVSVQLRPVFTEGTRTYEQVSMAVGMAGGAAFEVSATPLLHPWAYAGTGYDGGYADGLGLGVPRGELAEQDTYQLVPPEQVLLEGRPTSPGHREQFAHVTVNGVETTGYCTVMTRGALPAYGLT